METLHKESQMSRFDFYKDHVWGCSTVSTLTRQPKRQEAESPRGDRLWHRGDAVLGRANVIAGKVNIGTHISDVASKNIEIKFKIL
jgi:hypothetical protein